MWDLTRSPGMARIMTIMARRQPYTLIYARGVTKHLKFIDPKYDGLIREKMEEQLLYEPNVETKNRKPLRPPAPFAAQWEIRFGPNNRFRVLYDIDEEQHAVQIVAIGEKSGNRLIVGGEEVEL
jgi:mRNA-degrading endonuclease RelE of RelBE toxin-antitoxin system